jgi:hypothetical protein
MFSLIITIISIALVVALIAATMYYGGSSLSQGTSAADAAAFVSGAQQISGAIALFKAVPPGGVNNVMPVAVNAVAVGVADTTTLIGSGFLTSAPIVKQTLAIDKWTITGKTLTMTVKAPEVCTTLAAQGAGLYTCALGVFTFNY